MNPVCLVRKYSTRHLLEQAVNMNDNGDGWSPLHCALRNHQPRLAQLLIQHGADVSDKTWLGQTSLHIACYFTEGNSLASDYDLCKLMIEMGADCNAEAFGIRTPLHDALRMKSPKVVKLLLDNGADIAVADLTGKTALHHAAKNERHADVIEFVMDHYEFDIHAVSNDHCSPLHCAAESFNFEICEFLLKRGAMVNGAKDALCLSPLSLAAWPKYDGFLKRVITDRQVETVKILLEYGADVSVDAFLKISSDHGGDEIRKILMQHVARMMEYANSGIDADDLNLIDTLVCYREYYQTCAQEFKSMKEIKFHNNVTIYSIFINRENVISGYAKNEELVKALEEKDYGSMFPMGFAWLRGRFYKEVKRQKLRRKSSVTFFCSVIHFTRLFRISLLTWVTNILNLCTKVLFSSDPIFCIPVSTK